MDTVLHIPWTNEALEALLKEVIKSGEATKVDFKSAWSVSNGTEKAEVARDVQAFANSYDGAYRNHGFIILGAKPGELTYTSFSQNADQMQATVDQILREHIGPPIPTQVRQFGSGKETWGVIVVPPSRNAPHVFVRDTGKYSKGDIWVRVNTTTAKADPADFARFYRVQLDDHTMELRDQLRDLQRDVNTLKSRETAQATAPVTVTTSAPAIGAMSASQQTVATQAESEDLVTSIKKRVGKAADPVRQRLQQDANDLRRHLESKEIPWDLNTITKESGQRILDGIHERAENLWRALALLVENDDEGEYNAEVVEVLSVLAFDPEAPSGVAFTELGTGIRLYPLVMSLYIVFMIGLRKRKFDLLKDVMKIELTARSYRDDALPLGTALFYARRAAEVFQTLRDDYPNRRWCDGVGMGVRTWMDGHLPADIPGVERSSHLFYAAEFVLSLLGYLAQNIGRPAAGTFYFTRESLTPIAKFLKGEKASLDALFGERLRPALECFDEWGSKIALWNNCFGDGFQSGATRLVFPPPAKPVGT